MPLARSFRLHPHTHIKSLSAFVAPQIEFECVRVIMKIISLLAGRCEFRRPVINVNNAKVATRALNIHAPTPKHSFLSGAMVIFRGRNARATNFNSLWSPPPPGPAAVLLVLPRRTLHRCMCGKASRRAQHTACEIERGWLIGAVDCFSLCYARGGMWRKLVICWTFARGYVLLMF